MSYDFYTKERRKFFRVTESMKVVYRLVDNEVVLENDEKEQTFSLAVELDRLNQELTVILGMIERNNSTIADYLKILNSKIDAIAYSIFLESNTLKNEPFLYVNLSASGIGFECEHDLVVDSLVSISFLLTSCMNIIVCQAKVIYSKHNPNKQGLSYLIGVEYGDIKDEDTELIIKHVVKQQIQTLREYKKNY